MISIQNIMQNIMFLHSYKIVKLHVKQALKYCVILCKLLSYRNYHSKLTIYSKYCRKACDISKYYKRIHKLLFIKPR